MPSTPLAPGPAGRLGRRAIMARPCRCPCPSLTPRPLLSLSKIRSARRVRSPAGGTRSRRRGRATVGAAAPPLLPCDIRPNSDHPAAAMHSIPA
eukprot:363500-Chlamydomonas_euryale.AAC.17